MSDYIENMDEVIKEKISFTYAILTYPSDYDGLINTLTIHDFLLSKKHLEKVKFVIAKEDADEGIQRTHFHIYFDGYVNGVRVKSFFNIDLPYKILILIKDDTTREYKLLSDFIKEQNWNMASNLDSSLDDQLKEYCERNNYKEWKIVTQAHPNLKVKNKKFGHPFYMLRYLLKQKLLTWKLKDAKSEVKKLKSNKDELIKKEMELREQGIYAVKDIVCIIEELIQLGDDCIKRENRKCAQIKRKKKDEFFLWLKEMTLNKNCTENDLINEMKKNNDYWILYSSNFLNNNALIQKFFKTNHSKKPVPNYDTIFYVPRKLMDFLNWLDQWVMKWHTNQPLEKRPKGLVLISPTRYGKTQLLSVFGSFTYICNMWDMDAWEGFASFTIMDDIDPLDNEKGHTFAWYKGFFGAQDVVTVTDKFKPKKQLANGKPLVWISNYELEEIFKKPTDLNYIKNNMTIVHLRRPLWEKAKDWIEGHNDYVEFDPKTTWWYQNKVAPSIQEVPTSSVVEGEIDDDDIEKGRLIKRVRTEDPDHSYNNE